MIKWAVELLISVICVLKYGKFVHGGTYIFSPFPVFPFSFSFSFCFLSFPSFLSFLFLPFFRFYPASPHLPYPHLTLCLPSVPPRLPNILARFFLLHDTYCTFCVRIRTEILCFAQRSVVLLLFFSFPFYIGI